MLVMERLLSVKEVSEALGVSEETVKRWLRQRIIPGIKLGRKWRIKGSTLDSLKEKGTLPEQES